MRRRRPSTRVDTSNPGAESDPKKSGYAAAILISALGHAALAVLLLVVLPSYLRAPRSEPPSYTVKIVDNIPAGDLGSHLPRLSRPKPEVQPKPEAKPEPKPEPPKQEPQVTKPPPPPPPDNDKNAIALNEIKPTRRIDTPTPTPAPEPTPPPTPAPQPTPPPVPTATEAPKPPPTPKPRPPTPPPPPPTPKTKRTPEPERIAKPERSPKPPERPMKAPHAKPSPPVAIARVESTPSVKQQLAKLRQQLLAEHLAQAKKAAAEATPEADEEDEGGEDTGSGGGPVVANTRTEGTGAGIGSGTGSMGIQQNLDFLLYYRTVQERIKDAWSFSGGSNDLTTRVAFAIGPDGKVTGVKITQSSRNSSFDESVIRAIRRAAPFPAPPEKYRDQFAHGIEAVFKLGELNS